MNRTDRLMGIVAHLQNKKYQTAEELAYAYESGFAMALHLIGTKTLHLVSDAATEGVRVLRPSWAPALAFLSRSKPAKPADTPAAAAPDAWKDDVEKKLNR